MMDKIFSLEPYEIINREAVFRHCPNQALARFLPHVAVKSLQSGDELQYAGQTAKFVYLIVSGTFEAASEGGQKVNVKSGFLGQEAAIGMDLNIVTAVATSGSSVLVIPKAAIWELSKYPEFHQDLLNSFTSLFGREPKAVEDEENSNDKKSYSSDLRIFFGWLMALLVPLSMIAGVVEFSSIPNKESLYLVAILSTSIVMWIFRLLPDFVPALFSVLGIVLFGLAPSSVVLAGFGSKTFFMALSIFGLSAVIVVSGLSYRILLLLLKIGPANKTW